MEVSSVLSNDQFEPWLGPLGSTGDPGTSLTGLNTTYGQEYGF